MSKELKPITLHNDETNETYILTFTRSSIVAAEEGGFDINAYDKKPLSTYTKLIYFALQANHKGISKEKAREIADDWLGGVSGCPREVYDRLAELYIAGCESIKNSNVTVSL